MALKEGTRVGSYEVLGSLGAGGMGEVYRARDLKLDRDVALKILPSAFAADPDRLARFEREAKTLAALNHPLIAQIYGVEDSTDIRALVMELVEGETLDARIGGLSVDETLALAQQIAEALQAAHEQGIIHRDLKPANIKVRSDGTIKVLDFGLAKLSLEAGAVSGSGGAAGIDGLTQSPTLTLAATQAGIILGTAGYMSPEQAKGRAADKRSDVWSFGCVLYEMLTGRRAFDGEDVSDMLASVLKSDPDWSALPADVPPPIKTLIQRCLVKDRRARIADIAVVQFVLAEASALGVGPPEGGPHVEHRPAEAGPYVRRWMPIAAAALLAAALAGGVAWWLWPRPSPPAISRFAIVLPKDQQLTNTGRQMMAIDREGKQIVYIANNRLYLRTLSDLQPRLISGTESIGGPLLNPVFSPDGSSLAFYSLAESTIKRIDAVGGVAVTLCRTEGVVFGMSWDGSGLIYADGSKGIARCPTSGGSPERLVTVGKDEVAQSPQMLPDGKTVLFTLAKTADAAERWDKAQVVVHSLESGRRTTVLEGGTDARYVSTGHLLYALRGVIFAVPFDAARGIVIGSRVPIIDGVRRAPVVATGMVHMATSATGTLIYLPGPPGASNSELRIALNDRMGGITGLPLAGALYGNTRASSDGKQLAIDIDDGKAANVWIYEMAGGTALRRLTTAGKNRFPIWSAKGDRIAFQSDRDGDLAIFAQNADGSGAVERLTKPEKGEAHIPESWSPDGRYISLSVLKDAKHVLSILTVQNHTIAPFGNVESSDPTGSVFSPDGRWIAYHTLSQEDRASGGGVLVQPFPATGSVYPAPRIERDFHPVWSHDGSELFYVPLATNGRLAAVRVTRATGVTFGNPQLFPAAVIGGRTSGLTRAYDILPDGKFVGPVSASDTESFAVAADSEIRVVLNWFEELKARVPLGH
jgi:eukaryotic-like serine/threonine-protein kinase